MPPRENLKELRAKAQGRPDPISYAPARAISIYITRLLTGTTISPNAVTIIWALCLLAAAAAFAVGEYVTLLLAALLILLSYVLDCVDGELARVKNMPSKIGGHLEQMVHWVTNGVLLLAITFTVYNELETTAVWILGFLAVIGDYTFHFLYYQLNIVAN